MRVAAVPSSCSTAALAVALAAAVVAAGPARPSDHPPIEWFLDLASPDEAVVNEALGRLSLQWRDGYAAMILDLARFTRPHEAGHSVDVSDVLPKPDPQGLTAMPQHAGAQFASFERQGDATTRLRARLLRFLRRQTGQRFGDDLDRWRVWSWSLPNSPHPDYMAYKAELYARVSPAIAAFFVPGTEASVRLDELEWTGGAGLDVPPLARPAAVAARDARHMKDSHVVFGIRVDGAARAYPARILAPHQVVVDRVAGRDVLVAHCPMSGTTAAYSLAPAGRLTRFGASGLVYRSHSLMYDGDTRGLWSVLTGEQVVGGAPGTRLSPLPIDVTTWREWRMEQPETTVLAADTGHAFTYVEGAFTRVRLRRLGLLFPVAETSPLLPADRAVLGIAPEPTGEPAPPLAVVAGAVAPGGWRLVEAGSRRFVALSVGRGPARVYDTTSVHLDRRLADGRLQDGVGGVWRVTADALVREDEPSVRMPRVATAQTTWSAWYARFPETLLVK